MAYHYKDSGLDNIYLENGFELHETAYGRGVSIVDTPGLHRVIGGWLIELPKRLNGAELRFLRLEMDLSQRRLASLIGSEEQNIRRWEKYRKRPIPGTADRLVRALYQAFAGTPDMRSLIERLAGLDEIDAVEAHLHETEAGWELARAA